MDWVDDDGDVDGDHMDSVGIEATAVDRVDSSLVTEGPFHRPSLVLQLLRLLEHP